MEKFFRFRSKDKKEIHIGITITGETEIEEIKSISEKLRMGIEKDSTIRKKVSFDIIGITEEKLNQ